MTKEETDWRPPGLPTYDGNPVYFHNVAPYERNVGEVDGDIDYDDLTD